MLNKWYSPGCNVILYGIDVTLIEVPEKLSYQVPVEGKLMLAATGTTSKFATASTLFCPAGSSSCINLTLLVKLYVNEVALKTEFLIFILIILE